MDFVGAFLALLIASPLLLVCVVAICLDSRGPVLYRQWRVGQCGRPFLLSKLRTMVKEADKQGSKLTALGDLRITRVGRFLRKTKLDELPQLINVLLGQMSLVGPRPEVPEYIAKYAGEEKFVLAVKPGVTGAASLVYVDEGRLLAQQNDPEQFYVNTIMRHKLQLDLAYCHNLSFGTDLRILLETVWAVFARVSLFSRTLMGPAKASPQTRT